MVKEPESMDELIYFTNRTLEGGKGKIKAWVYKKECPQCKKEKMGKPIEGGKVKIRAKEYKCNACGFTEEKTPHEESLPLEAKYLCPSCGKEGESTAPYKRKSFMGVQAYVVECEHCGAKIPLTKKMKDVKKK
jgi:transcription elongation factor Elf1